MKRSAQLEPCQGKQLQWEILFERQRVWTVEIEKYSLPPWAGTWKFINFAFRQQKQKWDGIWPDYQQNLSNTSDRLQQVDEQVGINIIKMKMTVCLLFFICIIETNRNYMSIHRSVNKVVTTTHNCITAIKELML